MDRVKRPPSVYLFLVLALFVSYLQYRAETFVRGAIPPHSDSLIYQNEALKELAAFQHGALSWREFLFGSVTDSAVPPLFKWSLQLGYIIFGVDSNTPYIVSAMWLTLAALAVYLILRRQMGDGPVAMGGGLLLLGLPAALSWGFSESRNDWPVTALCLTSFYFFAESGVFKNTRITILGALFAGLALLTKSSLTGYLAFPLLFLLVYLPTSGALGKEARRSIVAGFAVILGVAGWFYVVKYHDISAYYSFWSGDMIANVRSQYQLGSAWDVYMFYPANILKQFGAAPLALVALGCVALLFVFMRKKERIGPDGAFVYGWAAAFAFGPYLLLIYRQAVASPADINMIPFILILGVSGLGAVCWQEISRKAFGAVLMAFALIINFQSLAEHYRRNYSPGADAASAARELTTLLNKAGIEKFIIWGLYYDLGFSADTLVNFIYLNPKNRQEFNASTANLDLKTKVSPSIPPEARYKAITAVADILIVPESSMGPKWLAVNQQWKELSLLAAADSRFMKLGALAPYADGPLIEVYTKNRVSARLEADGWLVNGGRINVNARPGLHTIRLEGTAHGNTVMDMTIVPTAGGDAIPGKTCVSSKGRCFEFPLDLKDERAILRVSSKTPLTPSKTGESADTRELLILNPSVTIER